MTDTTPDPPTMARILALVSEIHAELVGGQAPAVPPAAPERLAEVIDLMHRRRP